MTRVDRETIKDSEKNRLVQGLREAGAKITAQRIAICEYLAGNDQHPTAADVYAALRPTFPTMSLATVYNTLSLLVELNLIHEVASPADGSTRYDPQVAPHLNLICTNCNRIIDVDGVDLTYLEELTARYGFQVADVNVALHGLCAECRHNLN